MNATELKAIALTHFAEKGYDGASLAAIAGDAGIKKPSIYAHFPSKLELFRAIVSDLKADYLACWEEALKKSAALPPDQRLGACFSSVSHHYLQDRVKMAFWVRLWMFPPSEIADEIREELLANNARFIARIEEIFLQGISKGLFAETPPENFSHAFFCLIDGYLMRAICLTNFDYAKAGEEIWSSFLHGVYK